MGMILIPNYRVSYKGKFHETGAPFPIDKADEEEMREHGTVFLDETDPPREKTSPEEVPSGSSKTEKPHRGRPPKEESRNDKSGKDAAAD